MIQANSATEIAQTNEREKSLAGPVWIFLDWSNILVPAKYAAGTRDGLFAERGLRVEVNHLVDLVRRGRDLAGGCAVGSGPGLACIKPMLEARGIDVKISERGAETGGEVNVDEQLQARMLLLAQTCPPPATVVLVSGDGAGLEEGIGFVPTLKALAAQGYVVEGFSWRSATSHALAEWLGPRHRFLDPHYRSITFVAGGRRAEALNLAGSRFAGKALRRVRHGCAPRN